MLARFAITTALVAALCGVWRLQQFGQMELLGDQAYFTQWVLRLADSDHFLPKPAAGQGWFTALLHDDGAFLHILLSQIYQAQTQIFIVVSVLFFTAILVVVDSSMESVVAISIAASAIALWLLALFPTMCRTSTARQGTGMDAYAVGAIALVAGCFCSFLNIFSALGPHNSGLMFLMIAAIATQRWLTGVSRSGALFADRRTGLLMVAAQLLAIYAHYANVFMIAPATVVAILLDPSFSLTRRVGIAAKYATIAVAAFVPSLVLIGLYSTELSGATNDQTFAGIAATFVLATPLSGAFAIGTSASFWFDSAAIFYTMPGLLLGIAGAIGMAWRDRIFFPAAIVFVHFLFGTFLPIFTQYDRTIVYLLPMLVLGGAWTIVAVVRYAMEQRAAPWPRRGPAALLAVLVFAGTARHAMTEYTRIENPGLVSKWGAQTGDAVWRPVVARIDAAIPANGVLIPWSYGLSHQYRAISARSRRDIDVTRPLETMMAQWKAGTLRHYMDVRGLTVLPGCPTFVLAPASLAPEALNLHLQRLFGFDGAVSSVTPKAVLKFSWTLPRHQYFHRHLHFHEIAWQQTP